MSKTKKTDDRLRNKTFGLVFVDRAAVADDDLMLILDANMIRKRLPFRAGGDSHGPAVMVSAALAVMQGRDFKAKVERVIESELAIKLIQL